MADTRLWIGTDPGNIGDPTVAANWSPVGAPVTGDNLILRESSQNMLGADFGSGVDLASFIVNPSFVGTIGSSGSHLIFNGTLVQMFGGGPENWIEGETTSGIDTFIAGPRQFSANSCVLDGKMNKVTAVHGRISAVAGALLNEGTNPEVIIDGEGAGRQTVRVVFPASVTIANLTLDNGFCKTESGVTGRTIINGGTLQQLGGTLVNVKQLGGLHWHDDGVVTLTNVHGGLYDATRTARSSKVLTAINVYGPRGKFSLKNRAGVGKPTTLTLFGHPSFDDGQVLTVN